MLKNKQLISHSTLLCLQHIFLLSPTTTLFLLPPPPTSTPTLFLLLLLLLQLTYHNLWVMSLFKFERGRQHHDSTFEHHVRRFVEEEIVELSRVQQHLRTNKQGWGWGEEWRVVMGDGWWVKGGDDRIKLKEDNGKRKLYRDRDESRRK